MKAVFALSETDASSLKLKPFLESFGASCRIVKPGEAAVPGEIAIFSVLAGSSRDRLRLLMGRQMVFASHRLIHFRPAWASTTPFCHLIRPWPSNPRGYQVALRQLVDAYEKFDPRQVDKVVPWGRIERVCPSEDTLFDQLGVFRLWQSEVKALL